MLDSCEVLFCRERHEWFEAATAAPQGFGAAAQHDDKERLEEAARARYGRHVGRIGSLEASLNAAFDSRCDGCNPVGWPVAI